MDFLQNFLGGKPAQRPAQGDDSGFADFAAAPAPVPVSIPVSPADAHQAVPTSPSPYGSGPVVYTKWYRVWERTNLKDFQMEMYLIPFIFLALALHFWGTTRNKRKARNWMAVHAPVLDSEFALLGYHQTPKITPYPEGVQNAGLLEASAKLTGEALPDDLLREKSAYQFETYASGRLNVAFADFKLTLNKVYNPFLLVAENVAGIFFDSLKPQPERMEAILYAFDGNEKSFTAPASPDSGDTPKPKPIPNSTYPPFIFAVVNKMAMRKLRDERYDLSLTATKDNGKLPDWATTMSESAEITDTILTNDLVTAIKSAGDALEYLIVTDQPADKPTTLDEAASRKQLRLCMKLPSDGDYLPSLRMFQAFLRLPDYLVNTATFRPEVTKKITAAREAERAKLKKVSDTEAAEERARLAEKLKKEERDRKLKNLSADEQRKFLEKESAKEKKKQQKKMTTRA